MQTLEAVARHRSLSAAAREIGISVSAVAFQLREIEQIVGRKLVARSGGGVSIDPAAAAAAAQMTAPFATLRASAATLREPPRRRVVRMTMLANFAAIWFLPRLAAFHAANAEIEIEVVTGTRLVDLGAEQLDCGVRCGSGDWPELDCSALFPQRFGPVAHRAYLERAGMPADPAGLARHRLIASHDRIDEWHEWFAEAGAQFPPGAAMHLVDGRDLALAAVRAQAGIALLDLSLIADSLAAGDLVQLFDTALLSGWHHWFVAPAGEADPAIARLRDWLLAESRAAAAAAL